MCPPVNIVWWVWDTEIQKGKKIVKKSGLLEQYVCV